MNTTIDKAGRLVIPKAIRRAAQLEPGTQVRFRVLSPGRIQIEPVPLSVTLERRGGLVVAVPERAQPILKQSVVEDTIAAVRGDTKDSL